MIIASKGVCKMCTAQYFVSFWTHIHSKLILQFVFFFFSYFIAPCKLIVALLFSELHLRHESDINFQV